ncbi:MAG: class I SAM-dependent methyltransferase [Candidatus Marinimicrobia bacterium]|nr:class I SAM-dependent methyltransferase [Candidatus Neomarinimicrobiota bacterium]
MNTLKKNYEIDKQTWDKCAETYERQIVGGHPDILAFEQFEEDLLDRIIRLLGRKQKRKIKLMDIGCGSGRLHIRYGAKAHNISELDSTHPLVKLKIQSQNLRFDPDVTKILSEVWGVDFSKKMIDLAHEKIAKAGLNKNNFIKLTLEQGSAFELEEQSDEFLPIAICLVNSISVMQGIKGARNLFKSMRKAVESAKGIAIISCYQQEYIESYGLGQYESTMDVSGQPIWMQPDTYKGPFYELVPKQYKLAHSKNDSIIVDVFDSTGILIKKNHVLTRDPKKTKKIIKTGDIETYSNYNSHWYSYNEIQSLIDRYWDAKHVYHIRTKDLDVLRAEPAQMAILDYSGYLKYMSIK